MAGFGSIGDIFYNILAVDKTAEGMDSAADRFKTLGTVVGTAMTAIGAGMTLLTDKARVLNSELVANAIQLNVSTSEMRNLVLEISNVTFPLEEAISSMTLLTRAGMKNVEEIGITATAFDTLGDATGYSASEITSMMIPAFNAFNLELADASEYTDLFTHMQRNTTVEIKDFSNMLSKIAPDIDTLGISLSQTVAVIEALADKGIQGGSATRLFNTAISAANGDLDIFYSLLGLTASEVDVYSERLSESKGMTEEYANALNTQYGFIDRVKHSISELTLRYGSLLQPVEALGPSMAALGPILITVSNIQWGTAIPAIKTHIISLGALVSTLFTSGGALTAHSIGLKLATAAQWLLNASIYACPLVWIVAAIGGVIAALVILESKFGIVTKAVKFLSDGVGAIIGFFKGVGDAIMGVTVNTDALVEADERLKEAQERLEESQDRVKKAEDEAAHSAEDLKDISAELAEAQLEVAESAHEVEELTKAYDELKGAMDKVAGLTEEMDDLDRSRRHAEIGLIEAQNKYNEVLGTGSAKSEDAKKNLDAYNKALNQSKIDSDKAKKAQTDYNSAVKKYGPDSQTAQKAFSALEKAQNAATKSTENANKAHETYNTTVKKTTYTDIDKRKALLALDDAQDRLDDIQKQIIETTEEQAVANTEYSQVIERNSGKNTSDIKKALDDNLAAHKDQYKNIEDLKIKQEKARKEHEEDDEDVAREKLVYDASVKNLAKATEEKSKILKGEASLSKSIIGDFLGFFVKAGEDAAKADQERNAVIKEGINNTISYLGEAIPAFFVKGGELIGGLVSGIAEKYNDIRLKIEEGIRMGIEYLAGIASEFWNLGVGFISGIVDGITEKYNDIRLKIEEGINGAIEYLMGLPAAFFDHGVAIITAFIDGIKSVPGVIKGAIETKFNEAKSLLTHSDADEGPFSNLTESGKSVIRTFSAGITSASGMIKGSLENKFDEVEPILPHSDADEGVFSNLSGSGESVIKTFSSGIESEKNIINKGYIPSIAPISPSTSSGLIEKNTTYGGNTISIGNISLSRDYDFSALMRDMEEYQSLKRAQAGIGRI